MNRVERGGMGERRGDVGIWLCQVGDEVGEVVAGGVLQPWRRR